MAVPERHLVTGGSGYFGSLLIRQIRDRGHAVRVFDLVDTEDRPADVEFVRGDIRDPTQVAAACHEVSVVHHNVALVPLAKASKDGYRSVNATGTRILLEKCQQAGAKKVVHMSSSAVFGVPSKNPVDDQVHPSPAEAYGQAKLEAEDICHEFVSRGMDITIIRPRTIMGHGRLGIMQILFEWIRQGKRVPVLGGGANRYQFVHAEDLGEACLRAAERPGAATYNIGASEFGTMRQTIQSVIDHAQTGSKIFSLPLGPTAGVMNLCSSLGLSPLGPYHALMYGREMHFDLTRPREELGWEPRFGNAEMFRQSYDWYLDHRDTLMNSTSASSPHRSRVKQGVLRVASWFL